MQKAKKFLITKRTIEPNLKTKIREKAAKVKRKEGTFTAFINSIASLKSGDGFAGALSLRFEAFKN